MRSQKMDMDILDQLIGMCEDKMVSPLKKKKEITIAAVEPEEEMLDDEMEEGDDSSLSDMDLQELIEMYKRTKEG